MVIVLTSIYAFAIILLSLYGLLGFFTLWLYWRNRDQHYPTPLVPDDALPLVTIQLPIYNERFVIHRLLNAATNLDYPQDRLEIQVIDDSDDITADISTSLVQSYLRKGFNIHYLHRSNRNGYKAGALADAFLQARGEYIAIFDADFLPDRSFLKETVPHFINAPNLGVIQARWGHLNVGESPLTAAQSIALDKHFMMEQTVRHRANMFPKFNGTAGIWRRACIQGVGGWQNDTVCEDLCLSTRAVLDGWKFLYLANVVAPAELPSSIRAYKNQQARWAKGSIQCFQKYAFQILRDSGNTLMGKIYALLTMSSYITHIVLLVMLLLQIPMLLLNINPPAFLIFFSLLGIGQPILFVLAQKEIYPDWVRRLTYFPAMLFVAIGIAPNNCRAMLQIIFHQKHPFIRTPKGTKRQEPARNGTSYRFRFDSIIFVELFFALYAAAGLILAINQENYGPIFFLLFCLIGFSYVTWITLLEIVEENKQDRSESVRFSTNSIPDHNKL